MPRRTSNERTAFWFGPDVAMRELEMERMRRQNELEQQAQERVQQMRSAKTMTGMPVQMPEGESPFDATPAAQTGTGSPFDYGAVQQDFGPGTPLGGTESGAAYYKDAMGQQEAEAKRQQQETLGKAIQRFAWKHGGDKEVLQDAMNLLVSAGRQEDALKYMDKFVQQDAGGGGGVGGKGSVWAKQVEASTPEVKEKVKANINRYRGIYSDELLDGFLTAADANAVRTQDQFNAFIKDPERAAQILKETMPAKVETEYALNTPRVDRAYGTKTAGEQAERDIQREQPMYSGENAKAVTQNALAVKNLLRLKDALQGNNVDWFDLGKAGEYKNTNVANAYKQVSEIVGRQQSGAAINEGEWRSFGKEILNRDFLLTEQGRQTALQNLEDYLDRFYSAGLMVTSDPDWYEKFQGRATAARSKGTLGGPRADEPSAAGGGDDEYDRIMRQYGGQ